jgi:hypothetical protein
MPPAGMVDRVVKPQDALNKKRAEEIMAKRDLLESRGLSEGIVVGDTITPIAPEGQTTTREQYQNKIKTSYAPSRQAYIDKVNSNYAPSRQEYIDKIQGKVPTRAQEKINADRVAQITKQRDLLESHGLSEGIVKGDGTVTPLTPSIPPAVTEIPVKDVTEIKDTTAIKQEQQQPIVTAEPPKKENKGFFGNVWSNVVSSAKEIGGGIRDFATGTATDITGSAKGLYKDAKNIVTGEAFRGSDVAEPSVPTTARPAPVQDIGTAKRLVQNTEPVVRDELRPMYQDAPSKDKTPPPVPSETSSSSLAQPRLSTDGFFLVEDAGLNLVILGVV